MDLSISSFGGLDLTSIPGVYNWINITMTYLMAQVVYLPFVVVLSFVEVFYPTLQSLLVFWTFFLLYSVPTVLICTPLWRVRNGVSTFLLCPNIHPRLQPRSRTQLYNRNSPSLLTSFYHFILLSLCVAMHYTALPRIILSYLALHSIELNCSSLIRYTGPWTSDTQYVPCATWPHSPHPLKLWLTHSNKCYTLPLR